MKIIKQNIKTLVKWMSVFVLTLSVCVCLLVLVCKIPQSAIEENSRRSMEYLIEMKEGFPLYFEGLIGSRGDNYADSVLLNVIYHVDSERALFSVITNPYYRVEGESALDNYRQSVIDGISANGEYARYWHGSQLFIRPLLTIMPLKEIRIVMFVVLLVMNMCLGILLLRQKQYHAVVIYVFSLLLVHSWMVVTSLEYVMVFLVMTAVCIAVTWICDNREKAELTSVFIVAGTITCFLDFLTTETLAFTVPFILYLFLYKERRKLGMFRQELIHMIQWGMAWLASYAMAFFVKWCLVGITLGREDFASILESAAVRIDGAITVEGLEMGSNVDFWERLTGALIRNLACLFPVRIDVTATTVMGTVFVTLLILGAVFYLFRKDPVDGRLMGILVLIALIPYMRYICLSNHAYIHYFFTYRAQMATVMALLGIVVFGIKENKT